jgi:hypothetical protein
VRVVRLRRMVTALALVPALLAPAACSWFGGKAKDHAAPISVFDVKPGECFVAPTSVKAELSTLSRIACTEPHTQEAYAIVKYTATAGASTASTGADAFPGGGVLDKFAKGVCAQRYSSYVGVDYLNSKYYYTYLLPSARSWEQEDDRSILCFITSTGGSLTTSLKGSRR